MYKYLGKQNKMSLRQAKMKIMVTIISLYIKINIVWIIYWVFVLFRGIFNAYYFQKYVIWKISLIQIMILIKRVMAQNLYLTDFSEFLANMEGFSILKYQQKYFHYRIVLYLMDSLTFQYFNSKNGNSRAFTFLIYRKK